MDNLEKPQIIVHHEKSLNYTVYDVKWIPRSARLVTVGCLPRGTGVLNIYELENGGLKQVKEITSPESFKCGTFAASSLQQRHFATGDFKGRMQVWDLENSKPTYQCEGHSQIINCIDGVGGLGIGEGAPEICTGSRDGTVKVWDIRQKGEPVCTMAPEEGTSTRDCWSVCFGDSYTSEERCVAAGYDNGDVKIFDLRSMALRWETNLKNGVCSVQFDRKDIKMNKLVCSTLEGKFHVFDTRTQHPKQGFASVVEKAHKSTVWLASHLPQNRDVFMTTGGSGSLCLWKYKYPAKRTKTENGETLGVAGSIEYLQNCTVSTQPVCALDWNRDKLGLAASVSFDQCVRVLIVTKLDRL